MEERRSSGANQRALRREAGDFLELLMTPSGVAWMVFHSTPAAGRKESGVMPGGVVRHHASVKDAVGSGVLYMFTSIASCRISAEISTTFFLPVFFHQCFRSASRDVSPALCTIAVLQSLAYSVISPETM